MNRNIHRAGLAGLFCLAGVFISHAGDPQTRAIEVVPAHNAMVNTNVNASAPIPNGAIDKVLPDTDRSFDPLNALQEQPTPYRPPQVRPRTQREQEWLDRRKDWVFMSPEELMSESETDKLLGIKDYDKENEKKTTTAMERYYQHLFASDHSTLTNKSKGWTSEPSDKETNSFFGTAQNDNDSSAHPFDGPFNSRSVMEAFQPDHPKTFSDVFDLNPGNDAPPDEETIRARKEQQAHMDAFKQMWDIDQPVSSPITPAPVLSDSASTAGSFTGVQPVLGAASPSMNASSGQQTPSAPQSGLASERNSSALMHPPRFNNTMPGNGF